MSTGTHTVSPEAYLSSSHYEPDAEYVDGIIEKRAVGELDHAAGKMPSFPGFVFIHASGTSASTRNCASRSPRRAFACLMRLF